MDPSSHDTFTPQKRQVPNNMMTEQSYHRLEILFTTSYRIYVFIHTQLINNTKLINPKCSEELVNPGFSDWFFLQGLYWVQFTFIHGFSAVYVPVNQHSTTIYKYFNSYFN